ncbi:unnamed protein product [Anisakis simplex]|uniref:Activin_recp domain-containing protein n=1 Tax=Anisakis simplex TaxID=6269 RepID=A0A0M3IZ09_ANISI|nr:unnamed protein product [Anisakis simplex]
MKYFLLMFVFAFAIITLDALRCFEGYRTFLNFEHDDPEEGFQEVQCEGSGYCAEWDFQSVSDKYNISANVRGCEKQMDRLMGFTNCKKLDSDEDGNGYMEIGKEIGVKVRCCNTDLCNDPEAKTAIANEGSKTNPNAVTVAESSPMRPLICYSGTEPNERIGNFPPEDKYETRNCTKSNYCVDWSGISHSLNKERYAKACQGEFEALPDFDREIDCKDLIENGNGCTEVEEGYRYDTQWCCCASDLCNDKGIKFEPIYIEAQ